MIILHLENSLTFFRIFFRSFTEKCCRTKQAWVCWKHDSIYFSYSKVIFTIVFLTNEPRGKKGKKAHWIEDNVQTFIIDFMKSKCPPHAQSFKYEYENKSIHHELSTTFSVENRWKGKNFQHKNFFSLTRMQTLRKWKRRKSPRKLLKTPWTVFTWKHKTVWVVQHRIFPPLIPTSHHNFSIVINCKSLETAEAINSHISKHGTIVMMAKCTHLFASSLLSRGLFLSPFQPHDDHTYTCDASSHRTTWSWTAVAKTPEENFHDCKFSLPFLLSTSSGT